MVRANWTRDSQMTSMADEVVSDWLSTISDTLKLIYGNRIIIARRQ